LKGKGEEIKEKPKMECKKILKKEIGFRGKKGIG